MIISIHKISQIKKRYLCLFLIILLVLPVFPAEDLDFEIKGLTIEVPFPDEVDDFCCFIENHLAKTGVNTILLRIDYHFNFNTHPEVSSSRALDIVQVKKIVKACKNNQIALVPLMNLLGHQSTAFHPHGLLKAYPEFDETGWIHYADSNSLRDKDGLYPGRLYKKSYCPSNRSLHKITESLISDIIDAFECNVFSAGMDEVLYIGECQQCKETGKTKAELFAAEVNRINKIVNKKKCNLWIWGDRLLNADQWGLGMWSASENSTHMAIQLIDKDITILDWHYKTAPLTPVYFAMNGFNVISCPGKYADVALNHMNNLITYKKSAEDNMQSLFKGYIVTHWGRSYNFMKEFVLEHQGLATDLETSAASFFAMQKKLNTYNQEQIIQKKRKSFNRSIYVSENGSDVNDGTKRQPVYTLNKAVNLSSSGDTIRIHGIVFSTDLIISNRRDLILIGEGVNTTYLQPSKDLKKSKCRILNISNAGQVQIKDLTIRGGNAISQKHDHKFGGNIYVKNSELILENIQIEDGIAERGGGIYIDGTNKGKKHKFRHTRFKGNQTVSNLGSDCYITSNRYNETFIVVDEQTQSDNLNNKKQTSWFIKPHIIKETNKIQNCNIEYIKTIQ